MGTVLLRNTMSFHPFVVKGRTTNFAHGAFLPKKEERRGKENGWEKKRRKRRGARLLTRRSAGMIFSRDKPV